jgi:hypothetical protein
MMTRLFHLSLLVFALHPIKALSQVPEDLTPEDYADVAGIVAWSLVIPNDLKDGEVYEAIWRISNEQGKRTETIPSGLDFKMVPPGNTVKVFLWLDGHWDDLKSPRYCIKFRGANGKLQKREGQLTIPKGFTDIFSCMKSGMQTDDGWLMMITPQNAKNQNHDAAFLDLHYRSEDENRTLAEPDSSEQDVDPNA